MGAPKKYWEEEEFEDLVARSLIYLYEEEINKKWLNVPNCIKPSMDEIRRIKKFGVYYCPDDREIATPIEVDLVNDKLINQATLSMARNRENIYFVTTYMEKVKHLPGRYIKQSGTPYAIFAWEAMQNEPSRLSKAYVTISKDGSINDAYVRTAKGEVNLGIGFADHEKKINISENRTSIIFASLTMTLYQDKRYLWNVCAQEQQAKATFGVYPEQIKSLFYSRNLPQTETGRKRPILHWVAAHRRRIKEGIDIDIEKHLRGINEFEWHGTKFTITQPIKNNNQ
jgi:hypothetical protein